MLLIAADILVACVIDPVVAGVKIVSDFGIFCGYLKQVRLLVIWPGLHQFCIVIVNIWIDCVATSLLTMIVVRINRCVGWICREEIGTPCCNGDLNC